jgi:hypothetical protein
MTLLKIYYDATGTKLQKKITEGSRIDSTTYIGGFIYKNDTLQYILNEEGRDKAIN